MAKDPAFLFYPNDYIGGTMGMTFEEKGAYMELLMMQFNRGHMTEHMIGQAIGQIWVNIKDKFEQDEKGLFFNRRLEEEKTKRQKYTESRRNNKKGTNQHSKKTKKESGHMTIHMENENENEIIDNNVNECYENCLKFFSENLHPKTNKIKNDWIDTIDKLNRIDGIPFDIIEEIVKNTRDNDFWSKNFLSISKLRKKNNEGLMYIQVFYEQFKPKEEKWEFDHWFTEEEKQQLKQNQHEVKRLQ